MTHYYAYSDSRVGYYNPVNSPRCPPVAKPHRPIPLAVYSQGYHVKFHEFNYDNTKDIFCGQSVVRNGSVGTTDTTYTHWLFNPQLAYFNMPMSWKSSSLGQVNTNREIPFKSVAYYNSAVQPTWAIDILLGSTYTTKTATLTSRINYERNRDIIKAYVFIDTTASFIENTEQIYIKLPEPLPLYASQDSFGLRVPQFLLGSLPNTNSAIPVRATIQNNANGNFLLLWKDYAATSAYKANDFAGAGRFAFTLEYTTSDAF